MKSLSKYGREIRRFLSSIGNDFSKWGRVLRDARVALTDFNEEDVVISRSVIRQAATKGNYFNPLFWIVESTRFVLRYLTTRKFIPVIQGLPAILGLASPLFIGLWLTPSHEAMVKRARGQRELYIERQNYETADFFARKLCFLSPDNPVPSLDRATLLEYMDREDEAMAIAIQLADQQNYMAANEWICTRELQEIRKLPSPDDLREKRLVARLLRILETDEDNEDAHFMLGTYYLMRGQYTNARAPFEEVNRLQRTPVPEAAFSLALVHERLGNQESAQRHASVASDGFLQRLPLQAYSTTSIVQVLRALVLAEREAEAESMIRQLLPQRTELEATQLKWLLGDVCAQWARRLRTRARRTDKDLVEAVSVIHRGIAIAPNNPVVLDELTRLACSNDLEDELLDQQLKVALDSGVSPGLVHFIRGTRLLMKTPPDVASAMSHLQIAMQHDQAFPGLLNNVANAMLEDEQADLNQALLLVEQAITQMPGQPYFLDTRGSIFLRQKEYIKAIADLEKALVEDDLREVLHRKLADAYVGLNNESEAKRHLELADAYARMQEEGNQDAVQLESIQN
jgi:tetratricopeptide (TPR) repeat protein